MADEEKNELIKEDESPIPAEVAQVLDTLPVEQRTTIVRFFSQAVLFNRSSPEAEIAKKISSEHITQLLDQDKQAMEYEYKDSQSRRKYQIISISVVCVVVIALVLILKDSPDTLEKVLIGLGGVIAGAAGGYGIGKTKDKD